MGRSVTDDLARSVYWLFEKADNLRWLAARRETKEASMRRLGYVKKDLATYSRVFGQGPGKTELTVTDAFTWCSFSAVKGDRSVEARVKGDVTEAAVVGETEIVPAHSRDLKI